MGKNKRKMLEESTTNEEPTMNDPSAEEGTHQPEETMATPTKHKKHKKSKNKDQENLPEQPDNLPEQPNQADEQKTDKRKKKKRKAEEESAAEEIKPPKVKKQKMNTTDIPESVRDPTQVESAGHCSSEVVEEVSGKKHGEETKKKKKKKKKDHENREEDSSTQSGYSAVNTLQVEESAIQTGEDGDFKVQSEEVVKKERKKKKKTKHHQNGEEADSSTQAECSAVNSSQIEGSPMETGANADGNIQSDEVRTKEKKKKKKAKGNDNREDVDSSTQTKHRAVNVSQVERSTMETCADSNDNVQSEEVMNKEKKKKKKHKEKKSEQEPEKDMNGLAEGCQQNGRDFSEKTEKKKEKATKNPERKIECEENNEPEDTTKEKKQKKKDKKKKSEESTTPVDNVEEVKQKKKDKKKEKKDKSEETLIHTECTPNSKNVSETVKEEKASKKKRRAENMDENICKTKTAVPDSEDCTDETKSEKKKKKKSKDKEHEDAVDNDPKALGENTEMNNGGQKGDATTNPGEAQTNGDPAQAPFVGQWGTNLFKDNDRQNKFLRLLGGFKKGGDSSQTTTGSPKGLFGSLQGKENPSAGGQRALTYQAARAMDRRLECDYERALSFSARGQRGVGLGFQPDPAEGKKFHIDINKVSSKRFDAD